MSSRAALARTHAREVCRPYWARGWACGRKRNPSTSRTTTAFMLGCLTSSEDSKYDALAASARSGSPYQHNGL
jgi:hypothetical protein